MGLIENKRPTSEGFKVGSQTPIDDRTVFVDLTDLQDLGASNYNAYRYHEGLRVWVMSEDKEYVWKDTSGLGAGAGTDFTYPAGVVVNGVTYSGRTFNFYPTAAASSGTTYAENTVFVKNIAKTVTHNLGSTDIIVQLKDPSGEVIIPNIINNYTLNTVDINLSVSGTYRTIIK